MLFSLKKEGRADTCCNTDGPSGTMPSALSQSQKDERGIPTAGGTENHPIHGGRKEERERQGLGQGERGVSVSRGQHFSLGTCAFWNQLMVSVTQK